MSEDTPRFLHVANGTCTTRIIEAAGIPGARSIWADPLHEGPVPGGLTDDELLEVRTRFLSGPEEPTGIAWAGTDPTQDRVNDLHEWRAAIARHETYDELILWFEHDLFDQLNLLQLLPWIHERVPAARRVSLICVGSFPGRPDFKGLGQLTPDELASLLETRQPIGDAEYALAGRAWQAFRESTPAALDHLRRQDTSALPYLAAAIARFLQEYPWTTDGLSRTERHLMELAEPNGIALYDAFPRMAEGEQVYYPTDGSIASMAEVLSLTSPPLLTLDTTEMREGCPLRGSIALTDTGRAVLAGQADRGSTCGIDRWLGGVHLQGRRGIWRWDDGGDRVVRV
jgi:hypothetical protein